MNSLEQIKQLTKRKPSPLFFLKNKHAISIYKNHRYFEGIKNNNGNPHSQIGNQKWSMFVKEPTDYGINNTYKYMYQRTSPTLQSIDSKRDRSPKIKHERITTQHMHHYGRQTKSYYHRNRDCIINPHTSNTTNILHNIPKKYGEPPKDIRQLTFIQQNFDLVPQFTKIRIDLYPFILKSFRKSKIKYQKELTKQRYLQICSYIQKVKHIPESYFDFKNIINIGSLEELLKYLGNYKQTDIEWIETIRFFMMAPLEVTTYQYMKFIDQLKMTTILHLSLSIHNAQLYIYNTKSKKLVRNIYDLLEDGSFIFGTNEDVLSFYEEYEKMRRKKQSYQRRVKKWRNIANKDKNNINDQAPNHAEQNTVFISQWNGSSPVKRLNKHKLDKAYQKYKQKHKNSYERTKSLNNNIYYYLGERKPIHPSNQSYSRDIFE